MRTYVFACAIIMFAVTSAPSNELTEMAQFAQSICGDIPQGSYSKEKIAGAIRARAGVFARIFSGSADISGEKITEIYNGIPFEKLPLSIPTESMCKLEVFKILNDSKSKINNTTINGDGNILINGSNNNVIK